MLCLTSQWSFYVEEEQEVSDRCARPVDPDKKFALKTSSSSSFFFLFSALSVSCVYNLGTY